jgi:hypothetical protein
MIAVVSQTGAIIPDSGWAYFAACRTCADGRKVYAVGRQEDALPSCGTWSDDPLGNPSVGTASTPLTKSNS